ncbi:MAG: transpeptidase family protein [Tannerella sp.]|jgi:cell division protein FtsI (penicillin-binding protein 3)|nr:transpeptidase family protein [Tannerella sp.]
MPKKETTPKGSNEKDTNIFFRYFFITMFLVAVGGLIIWKSFKIGVTEREEWLELASKDPRLTRSSRMINPTRGSIFSDDDRLMAVSAPQYKMFMDFKAEGFPVDSFLHGKRNGIDSLAYRLSKKLKNRTPEGYKAYLLKGLKAKSRRYPVYDGRVSYLDFKEIKSFPFFRLGSVRSGFYSEEVIKRDKPFGLLAARTIGNIVDTIDVKTGVTHGRHGLEMQYDSLLCGVAGWGAMQRTGWKWTSTVEIEPTDGMDIRSTIDINIQDLVEKALTDKLKEINAFAGTAVVMEVKTGEIKAITNMERAGQGRYNESLNHAVADQIEPGSTFKVASMMVAIEDGVVEPSTPVNVGNGVYRYEGASINDHNINSGGYGLITAEKAIWYSSNIGVAKIIMQGYGNNPKKFIEGLHRIGMDADLKLEIPGAGKAALRWPDSRYWSRMTLPWSSFGYEVTIPPIQTLAFFNAIANDGKMMRPMFVRDVLKNGRSVKHFEPEVIIPEICSERTLKIIQGMLYNVVNYMDPTSSHRDGTGKPAKSSVITIAGKTGTAQIASHGVRSGHNVTFCGYFPYEDPMYTCIVVINRPGIGLPSGGLMCGTVVKDIAEKIYSNCTVLDIKKTPEDTLKASVPKVKSGNYTALANVMDKFDIKASTNGKLSSKYVHADAKNDKIELKELTVVDNLVPNVVGMGAKDAVYALESCGLRVTISGQGSVVSQSVGNGVKITPGQTVTLTLK